MKSPQPFGLRADFSDHRHKPVICPTRQVSKSDGGGWRPSLIKTTKWNARNPSGCGLISPMMDTSRWFARRVKFQKNRQRPRRWFFNDSFVLVFFRHWIFLCTHKCDLAAQSWQLI
jgi:hypothetical protein